MIKSSENSIVLSFVGDISLNNHYELLYQKKENPFRHISKILKNSIVVGNLECFVRSNQGVNKLKIPRLETSVETLNYLKDLNLQVACLANNHVFDTLEDGFKKTLDFLDQQKIKHFGAALHPVTYNQSLIIEKSGIKIGLLNYVTADTNPKPPDGIQIKLNWFNKKIAKEEIKQLKKKVDHVVVILHWGGRVEGGLYPDWDQPKTARKLIDAGADLLIGHHSHTVQPFEIYKEKYIFYSLGNFCFSDIYHEGKLYSRLSPRQKIGVIVNVKFGKDSYTISHQYILNNNGSINLIRKPFFLQIYQVIFPFLNSKKFIWKIYFFKFKKIDPIINYLFIQRKSPFKAMKISKIKRYLSKR